jgi:acyl-ACP thioesterase
MKFTNKIKTDWHDTDANRCVRPSKILEYMQATANVQCESSGLSLDGLRDEKGLAFILGALSMNIYKPLHAYEDIEVRTWCKEAKSFIFMRYFDILRDGELIAEASSTWVLIDINTKSMVRASGIEFFEGKFYYDEPVDPTRLLPKAKLDRDAELYEVGKRKIYYSDIDYNMHMNNTHYPDMICDHIEEMTGEKAYYVSGMSLSYLKESRLGATLTVKRNEMTEDGKIGVRTLNEAGEPCLEAVVRLEKIN